MNITILPYVYFCIKDPDFFRSSNHPDLQDIGSPTTKKCFKAYWLAEVWEKEK